MPVTANESPAPATPSREPDTARIGLGIAGPRQIDLVGDDVSQENFGFTTRKSLVIRGDQLIRKDFRRPIELFHQY